MISGVTLVAERDGQPVVVADDGAEFVRVLAEVGLKVDLDAVVAEDVNGGLGEFVGYENLGHWRCVLCGYWDFS